ncbi:unnamed protein product, partial [Polarella glacialis]
MHLWSISPLVGSRILPPSNVAPPAAAFTNAWLASAFVARRPLWRWADGRPTKLRRRATGERWERKVPRCRAWGCTCTQQPADYAFRTSADYHKAHPAVSDIARWRLEQGLPPPPVFKAKSPCGWRTRSKLA